jgi:hypothetical protein
VAANPELTLETPVAATIVHTVATLDMVDFGTLLELILDPLWGMEMMQVHNVRQKKHVSVDLSVSNAYPVLIAKEVHLKKVAALNVITTLHAKNVHKIDLTLLMIKQDLL